MKQHIWLLSGCRSGSRTVRGWGVWTFPHTGFTTPANTNRVFSPQACATQTTSACCLSPSTTDRLASWSPMTPVCTMTLTGAPLKSLNDLLSVGRCQTEAVMLQISSPTRPTMRADTASALRPTSHCSTWRSSWRLSGLCSPKNSRESKKNVETVYNLASVWHWR